MTKPRDLAESVNPNSIPGARIEDGTIDGSKLSPSLSLSADKISFVQAGSTVESDVQNKLKELVSVLDFIPTSEHSAIRDGTSTYDATSDIQSAIGTGGRTVIVPPGTYNILPVPGVRVPSNTHIVWQGGSTFKVIPNVYRAYQCVLVRSVQNVRLTNPRLVGDRYAHVGPDGEWGHGLSIVGSTNVVVENASISEMWGDGVYVGQTWSDDGTVFVSTPLRWSKNVAFIGETSVIDNRRDGVTIISADGLYMDTVYAEKINSGAAPNAGFNFEPNNANERLRNVRVNQIVTENHPGNGFQMGLRNMTGATYPVSVEIGSISSSFDGGTIIATNGNLTGHIHIGTFTLYQANTGGMNLEKLDNAGGLSVVFDNIIVRDCNRSGQTSARFGSALRVWRDAHPNTAYPLGNLLIKNLYINSPLSAYGVYFADVSTPLGAKEGILNILNIERLVTGSTSNFTISGTLLIGGDPTGTATVQLTDSDPSAYTCNLGDYRKVILGHTTKGTDVLLPSTREGRYGLEIKVLIRGGFPSSVTPAGGEKILMLGKGPGAGVSVTQQGALLHLKASSDGWEVLSAFGNWS